ncbi:MAG: ligand-binding sensor domain-containing protein [Gammaproteobacteria bacterium]
MRLSKAGWLCLILTLAVACSDDNTDDKIPPAQTDGQDASQAQAAATRPRPQVIEVFNVGPTTYVRSLAIEAGSNRLWVGTSLGVNEIDLDSHALLNTFTRDHGLANEYVFGIGIDPDGYKWFGTNAGGMSRYKDGEWKTFFPMHGLADYWIYAFANDLDGGLWIGTWAGANYLDRQTQEFRTYVKELINEWVYGISVDSKGVVWFGTEGGVSRFDGETWTAWNHEDGLGGENPDALPFSRNTGLGTRSRHDLGILAGGKATYNPGYIFSILADHEDTIWAGTWGGGVTRYKNGAWTNLMEKDGLAGNIVYSIAQGPDGSYWFGTDKGLSRYDGKNWDSWNVHHGLPNNDVYAIAIEAGGNVWVGTLGGVSRLGMKPAAAQ